MAKLTIIKSVLPPQGGHLPVRAALTGILFVLQTGIVWQDLPAERDCGSGMTCWPQLRNWLLEDTGEKLHAALQEQIDNDGRIDWLRGCQRQLQRPRGWESVSAPPTERGKNGVQHHLTVDGKGTPLAARVSPANFPDADGLLPTVVACPLSDDRAHTRLPNELYVDRASDADGHEGMVWWMGIEPVSAQCHAGQGSGLGKHQSVVEPTIAAVHQNRRFFEGVLGEAGKHPLGSVSQKRGSLFVSGRLACAA